MNERTENIGARRLHTVLEKMLEEISFEAPEISPARITITPAYVRDKLADIARARTCPATSCDELPPPP